jgi:hypothetical protein
MSQADVERVIGRLATDEHWRARYRARRAEAPDALMADASLEVTTTERRALLELSPEALDRFASAIDARLQRLGVSR